MGTHGLDDRMSASIRSSCAVDSWDCRRVFNLSGCDRCYRLGVVLLFQSASVVLQYSELLYEAGVTNKVGVARVCRGITAEFMAGMAGIVLGVLALLRTLCR